jgi:hypothetical protein
VNTIAQCCARSRPKHDRLPHTLFASRGFEQIARSRGSGEPGRTLQRGHDDPAGQP